MTYLLDMLNLTCTISRAAFTQNSTNGSVARAYASNQTSVICTIQAASDTESMEYQRRLGSVVYRAYFLPGVDVRIDDRLSSISGTAVNVSGRTFRVISPANDVAGQGDYTTCLCVFYTGDGQS